MNTKEEYLPYKIIHHRAKIDALKGGIQPVPLQVQLVPSNACNHRCVNCSYRLPGYLSNESFDPKLMLDYDKIIETLRCMTEMGIPALQITGGGEPLVYPLILDVLKEALNRQIEFSLVTNGQGLTRELCSILGMAQWVRVSVDAATAETHSVVHRVSRGVFEEVCEHIKTLVDFKIKNTIGVGFVVQRGNYKEIFDAAQLFKNLGVDNFRISAAFTTEGYRYFGDFMEEAVALAKMAEGLSDDHFTVFNLFGDRVKDLFEGKQDYDFCPIKDLMTYIGADYNVYTCCTLAYNKKGLIGSIKNQSFRQLWESQEKVNRFASHTPRRDCPFPCLYKSKNQFINYCTATNPKHINYI